MNVKNSISKWVLYLIIVFPSLVSAQFPSNTIVLRKVEGMQFNDTAMLLPKFGLRINNGDSVFVRDSLVFTPAHNFKIHIMEYAASSQSVVISAIHPNNIYSSSLYMHGKQDILVIPLAEKDICLYYTNIKGYFFYDFDVKTQTVFCKNYDRKIEGIKAKK